MDILNLVLEAREPNVAVMRRMTPVNQSAAQEAWVILPQTFLFNIPILKAYALYVYGLDMTKANKLQL